MKDDPRKFWNPYIETLQRDSIRAIQMKNLKNLIRHAKQHCSFFKEKYHGIDPEDLIGFEDVKRLPMIQKEDLRQAQENKSTFLFGDMLGVPPEEVTHFRQTSGTTGKPVYVPESWESWGWRTEVWCHILWMAGFRETDRVFIPFGYNVYVAFWEAHCAAEKVGCMVVPGGALDTEGRINKIREVRATGLFNTPTYGIHMAEVARKMGINPKSLGIQRMICAGEPLPRATRLRLEGLWGAEVYDHIGGTEPCGWASMCDRRDGLHILEPYFLVEILDLETESQEVAEGELGVAVVSALGRRSFPMIRFNTKDIVRKGKSGCECGRTSMMIREVVGRADHIRKVRGVLFSPVSVEELLRSEFPQIGEYEITVERTESMDAISLKFEVPEDSSPETVGLLTDQVGRRLKVKTNLRFELEPVEYGTLTRYTLKARRFKDLRE